MLALAQECGADVNAAKQDGFTALILAAQGGHTATVRVLAQVCGADVNAAMQNAMQNGFTALMITAANGHTATVAVLALECRAEVNAALQNGETALMLAVEEGHQDTVLCFVSELKVSVGASNSAGASCLHAMAVSSWAATSDVMASGDQVHHDAGCDGCGICPIRPHGSAKTVQAMTCARHAIRSLQTQATTIQLGMFLSMLPLLLLRS